METRFRITAYPGVRLPHPPIWQPIERHLSDGVIRPTGRGLAASPPLTDVDEVYLELQNLDLADERAIVSFVNRYGILGVGAYNFSAFASYRPFWDVREQVVAGIDAQNREE